MVFLLCKPGSFAFRQTEMILPAAKTPPDN